MSSKNQEVKQKEMYASLHKIL